MNNCIKKQRSSFYSAVFIVLIYRVYAGFLIVKLRNNATIARLKSITNGAMYAPLMLSKLLANFVINAAAIRLKFIML